MGRKGGGVRPASDRSIEIDFYYRGARCRERLKLAPLPRNLRYAENLLGQIKIEIEKGTFDYADHFPTSARAKKLARTPGALMTVSTALSDWLERKKPELEHSTTIEYERAVRCQLIPAFGDTLLRDLSRHAVKTWAASKGTSAKRLNNTLSPLRQMMAEAIDDGLIDANPLLGLRIRRKRDPRATKEIDPFTPAEIAAILKNAEGQFHNLCAFNFFSGLRTSELIALKWSDVDLVGGTVRIQSAWVRGREKSTKTASGTRTVTLMARALEALKNQKAHTLLAGHVVFQDPNTGGPWKSDKNIREYHWKHVLRRAGVRYRYPYQMRHTFASMLLSAGENVMWVASQLGHRDWTMTARRYARWIPSLQPDAGSKAEAAWVAAGGEKADQKADQTMPKLAKNSQK